MMNENDCDAVKRQIKDLIDGMPPAELLVIKRFVQYVRDMEDPFLRNLAEAPWDDEPLTDDDIAALAEAKEDIKAGRLISHDEVMRELGLRLDE